jgi:hypothetical protein
MPLPAAQARPSFHRYNLPGSRQPSPGHRPAATFPGLKPLEEMPIEAVAPGDLARTAAVGRGGDKLLVIDLPGEELPVLRALWDATHYNCLTR